MEFLTILSYVLGIVEAFLLGDLWGISEVPNKSLNVIEKQNMIDIDTVILQNKDFHLKEKKYIKTISFLKNEKRNLDNLVIDLSKYGNDMCEIIEKNHADLLSLNDLIDHYKLKLEEANQRISSLKSKLIEYDNLHKRQIQEIVKLQKQNSFLVEELKKYKKD